MFFLQIAPIALDVQTLHQNDFQEWMAVKKWNLPTKMFVLQYTPKN